MSSIIRKKLFSQNAGTGGGSTTQIIRYNVLNYSALATLTPNTGEFAYVQNEQGTKWLPGTIGGTYYASGLYYYTGTTWINDLTSIAAQLALNDTAILALQTGKVPYTGATTNVNLGEYGITTGQINLDLSPTGTAVVGTTRWNNTSGITETTLLGGSVVLKNGSDLVARVVNNTGIQLTKAAYQVVKISGAQGQRLAVDLAQANNDVNSVDTLGLVIETINDNQEGFIMTLGQLEEINTTGSLQGETWVDGDVLYLSTSIPGGITKIKPNGSIGHIVVLGYVEYAHANHGKIFVKILNGWELEELHNVFINPSTLANNNVLAYNSSSQLWENETIAQVITLTTTGTSGASTLVGNTLNIPTYAIGLTYFTESQNTSTPNATVPVDSLTAVSAATNADIAIIPKGTGAILRQIPDGTITGGNKRGANAIDFQYSRTLNTQVASGIGAVCFGTSNYGVGSKVFCVGNDNNAQGSNSYLFGSSNGSTAGYDFSTAFGTSNAVQRRSSFASGTSNTVASRDGAAFGDGNSVTSDYSFAFGSSNTTSGIYSVSIGYGNSASGQTSIALGKNASTGITRSKLALSGGQESTRGDAQFGIVVLKNRTTNAITTRLFIEATGGVASTQVYPPGNGAYRFKGTIIGKQTGTLNAAAWDIDGIIVKGATEASVSLLIGNVVLVQNTPAWGTPTLTADNGSGGIAGTLNISVLGAAATNIQWVCTIQTTEVIY